MLIKTGLEAIVPPGRSLNEGRLSQMEKEELLNIYEQMVLIRMLEERAAHLLPGAELEKLSGFRIPCLL